MQSRTHERIQVCTHSYAFMIYPLNILRANFLNHTQYKISLTFSYKTTFESELRPHTPSYVSFSYKSPSNCTTKQEAYKCRVPQPSSAAGKRRNGKNVSFYTLLGVSYNVRYVNIFMKVVLATSMTPYENVVLY